MEDEKILDLFWRRDEGAIEAAKREYGSYCAAVAGRILPDGQDVEEVVNDTWLRAWESIPPNRPGSLKLYLARAVEWRDSVAPGTVVVSSPKEGLFVRCGEGALEVLELQAPGGKRMAAKAYLMGKGIEVGAILGRTVTNEA